MKISQMPSSSLNEISTGWINAGLGTADVTLRWKVQWDYLFRQNQMRILRNIGWGLLTKRSDLSWIWSPRIRMKDYQKSSFSEMKMLYYIWWKLW